jgi:hypothetical protein
MDYIKDGNFPLLPLANLRVKWQLGISRFMQPSARAGYI